MSIEQSSSPGAGVGTEWMRYGLFAGLAALGVVALFHQTAWSMVEIWIRSETFAHGFLIVPIAAWLAWGKRAELLPLTPQPEYRALLLILPLGFAWLLGRLVDVLVVQQFAFVGILLLALWGVLGNRVTRLLAFPLGFLFLAVPVGEGLIPPMMDFTADFTVEMLRMTGIPVYREGTFFSIPSGDWSVVEGCSGVRYLIASVTLGLLYAYLTYTKLWKRLLFVLVSIVVPVIANGLRAYMIVMIAHLSDMKLALGVDHFIYGWVFFGIVITIMFVIGAFWRDPPKPAPQPQAGADVKGAGGAPKATLAALAVAGIWPLVAYGLEQEVPPGEQMVPLTVPTGVEGWQLSQEATWDWRPEIVNPDGQLYRFYRKEGRPVGLYLGLYLTQRQGAELVNSQNIMVREKNPVWSNKGRAAVEISLDGSPVEVRQAKIVSRGQRLLVWYWYRVGDHYTSNPYLAKILEALNRLTGGRRDGSFIVVSTPYEEKMQEAVPVLQGFLDAMLPAMERSLDGAAGSG